MTRSQPSCLLPVLLFIGMTTGCIRAPDVILLDQRTALERQAIGEFPALEETLMAAGVQPGPEALTQGQLMEAGWDTASAELDEVMALYGGVRSTQDQVNDLLRRQCLGEGLDGLLLATTETCTGDPKPGEVDRVVQQVNRGRAQLWEWISRQNPGDESSAIVPTWRASHLASVVCGGQVQSADGSWVRKDCR